SRGRWTARSGRDRARRGWPGCGAGGASRGPPRSPPFPWACRDGRSSPPPRHPSRARESSWRARLQTQGDSSEAANYTRRMMLLPFSRPVDYEPLVSAQAPGGGHWFVFRGTDLLVELGPPDPLPSDDPRVRQRPSWARLPLQKNHNWLGTLPLRTLYLGRLRGVDCWAAEAAPQAMAPAGMAWEGLRALFSVLDDAHFALAGRALQLVEWDRTHQYCGRCGTPTEAVPAFADDRLRLRLGERRDPAAAGGNCRRKVVRSIAIA